MFKPGLSQKAHQEAFDQVSQKGVSWLRSKHADWILAGISFAESVFAPILIDPFLIAMIMAKRALWKRYVLFSIAGSVLGGVAGYILGALFFDTIGTQLLGFFGLEAKFADIAADLDSNGFVFVLIGAFTPIPYKLVALASGFVYIDFLTFLIASLFGRLFRLGLVGFAAHALGPKTLPIMQRNLHLLAAIVGALLIAYIFYQLW